MICFAGSELELEISPAWPNYIRGENLTCVVRGPTKREHVELWLNMTAQTNPPVNQTNITLTVERTGSHILQCGARANRTRGAALTLLKNKTICVSSKWFYAWSLVVWTQRSKQATFWNVFSWTKTVGFQIECDWNIFIRIQLVICQHWFRRWVDTQQGTGHHSNQCWPRWRHWAKWVNSDGLMQACSNSIANALELLPSCTEPSIW